jgi:hypothetical protein
VERKVMIQTRPSVAEIRQYFTTSTTYPQLSTEFYTWRSFQQLQTTRDMHLVPASTDFTT